MIVTCRREIAELDDLPAQVRVPPPVRSAVVREKTVSVADELYRKIVEEHESFWNVVYPLYMKRDITRKNVRDLVQKGLEETRGHYKIVLGLFNMQPSDYKRFLGFLRKHQCHVPFKGYRSLPARKPTMAGVTS